MDGFGFDRRRVLVVLLLVALSAGCSVSLADTSPDVLDYCPLSVRSEHDNDVVGVSHRPTREQYDSESHCVRRLPEA